MNDNFSFDDVEDAPEILENPDGTYVGNLSITEAKAKKGSNAKALRVKFETEVDGVPKLIFARIGLLNRDGGLSFDAPAFKRIIKPFLEKANMSGQLSNVIALFTEFPCKATFRTDVWEDDEGVERNSVRLLGIENI